MDLCNLLIEYTFYYGERAAKKMWMRPVPATFTIVGTSFLFLLLLGTMQGGTEIQSAGSGVVDALPPRFCDRSCDRWIQS
eukprot:Skav232415  [mRNA]  locus=scaffold189:8945:12560:+ [translate_table: standard]